MKTWTRPLILILLVVYAGYACYAPATAEQRPAATTEGVGISSERLGRLRGAFSTCIAATSYVGNGRRDTRHRAPRRVGETG